MLDPERYTILCKTSKYCDVLNFFLNTNTIVLQGNTKNYLFFTDFRQRFILELAEELKVTPQAALEKFINFFEDKTLLV